MNTRLEQIHQDIEWYLEQATHEEAAGNHAQADAHRAKARELQAEFTALLEAF